MGSRQKSSTGWTAQGLDCYSKIKKTGKGKLPKCRNKRDSHLRTKNGRMHIWKKKLGHCQQQNCHCKSNDQCLYQVRGAQLNPRAWPQRSPGDHGGHGETVRSGCTRMFGLCAGGGPRKEETGMKGPVPARMGSRKAQPVEGALLLRGRRGARTACTGDPPPRFVTSWLRNSLLGQESPPLYSSLFRFIWPSVGSGINSPGPIHSYLKTFWLVFRYSLYTLEPPFHFTELLFTL